MISAILVSITYVAAQIFSNIASLQIVLFMGLSLDAGTFIYPITFTLRDLAHKVLGTRDVRILVIAAAVINLLMALFFRFVAMLPPDTAAGSSELWASVLSPVWRITLASIIAQIVAELIDTEIYRLWTDKITHRFQWMRVLTSNAISIPTDSAIFCGVAFYGAMPFASVLAIFWSNVIIKGLVTLFSLPLIYVVREREKTKKSVV